MGNDEERRVELLQPVLEPEPESAQEPPFVPAIDIDIEVSAMSLDTKEEPVPISVFRSGQKEKEGSQLLELLRKAPELIHFKPGYSELSPVSFGPLQEMAELLANVDDMVRVEGHINTVKDDGTVLANDDPKIRVYEDCSGMVLSQRRAESVVDFLKQHGVHPDRLEARGMGGNRPLTLAKEQLSLNRRVEIHLCK